MDNQKLNDELAVSIAYHAVENNELILENILSLVRENKEAMVEKLIDNTHEKIEKLLGKSLSRSQVKAILHAYLEGDSFNLFE